MFEKSISLDENILRRNKIPLLIEDKEWMKLFGDSENRDIQNAKEELIELVDKEKNFKKEKKNYAKKKTKYMKMILKVSDTINNEDKTENIGLLDKYKEEIEYINEELDEVKFQLEMIPKEIQESNFKLLTATIEYGYNELKYKEKILKKSIKEIEALRKKLMSLLETKHTYEKWVDETYTFLHGLLGREVIEEIDKQKLK